MDRLKELKDKITPAELFYTILGWTMFVLVNLVQLLVSPIIILISLLFDKDKKLFAYSIKFFYQIFYFLNFVQKTEIDKNGIKAPKKGERRIYAINHASMFDVILMSILPGPIKSLMKESYAKLPLIGWIAVLAGNIVMKDDDDHAGNKMSAYMKVVEKLERGCPIVIYPEGTKSKDSKVGKFHHGTFKIAMETQSDIVPVVFDTWNIIRPGGFWIRDVHHKLRILDPLKYNDFKEIEYKELSKIVRFRIIEGLLKVREERRKQSKNYYRNKQKYIDIDNEMKEELIQLKEKLNNEIKL